MHSKSYPSFGLQFFIKWYRRELVDAAYLGILGRPADIEGRIVHAEALGRSANLSETLNVLSRSDELAFQLPYANILENRKRAVQTHFSALPHFATSNTKILLLGNCQVRPLARLMQAMLGDAEATAIELLPETLRRLDERDKGLSQLIHKSELIFVHLHGEAMRMLEKKYPKDFGKVRRVPRISYSGFHPDIDYVEDSKLKHIVGPMGAYQSSIAFLGWKNSLSIEETLQLFREDVYESLGYFEYGRASMELLLAEREFTDIRLENMVDRWSERGCWMHSMNHPKLFALADLARTLLERENIETIPGVEEFVDDEMSLEAVWPMYPEIARRFGLTGHYLFKRPADVNMRGMAIPLMSLEQFIAESFAAFSRYPKDELQCHRLNSKRFQELKSRLENCRNAVLIPETVPALSTQNAVVTSPKQSPYASLPDYQFWRRAVERVPVAEFNPVVNVRFKLSRENKVATAGSCFAQHISRTLQKNGFAYYVAEPGNHLANEEAMRRNYDVFSARYGNVYTARQLVQLFDRAYDRFTPVDTHWVRSDGRFVDPFRPQIEVDGFESAASVEKSRLEHFAAVREMFGTLDVFVFTLGLTEAWRSRHDGAVFPLAPGVVAGEMTEKDYEFVNFGTNEVVADMQSFIDKLLTVNRNAKIILTVSPVPLIATYENQHVLVATTYSKSVLRVAAGEITRQNTICDYFPSFEIITGAYNRGMYFESDLRSIKPEGVDHVMRLFMSTYGGENGVSATIIARENSNGDDIKKELALVNEIVCDEEAIDPVRRD